MPAAYDSSPADLRSDVPPLRVRVVGDVPVAVRGKLVVYWMTVQRRTRHNFALQRAVDWARQLERPLVVTEVLGCGGRGSSERHHRFVLQGMADNAADLDGKPALYYPFVEREPGEAADRSRSCARRMGGGPRTGPADP